MLDAVQIVYGF